MLCWLSQRMCGGRIVGRERVQPEMGMGRSLQSVVLNMKPNTLCFGKSQHLPWGSCNPPGY